MSTLKDSIEKRRAIEPAELACVSIGAQTSGVIVSLWQSDSWVLPWSYLISARCTGNEECGQLVLFFTTQVVTADGQKLIPVLEAVAGFRLHLLRELPLAYRTQFAADDPFISRIEVRPSETTKLAPRTS